MLAPHPSPGTCPQWDLEHYTSPLRASTSSWAQVGVGASPSEAVGTVGTVHGALGSPGEELVMAMTPDPVLWCGAQKTPSFSSEAP